MRLTLRCSAFILTFMLAGCASVAQNEHAATASSKVNSIPKSTIVAKVAKPVRHRTEWRPESYVVQKGDTLYGISLNFGFDYRELATINDIQNPSAIAVGQVIRLFPNKIEKNSPQPANQPLVVQPKDQPKLVKYPYSDAALALINNVQLIKSPEIKLISSVEPAQNPTTPDSPNQAADITKPADSDEDEKEEPPLDWGLPTQGKLITHFSESANRKGIDIAGKLGQPILASAAGKVVYSGSGLRGYGKLIIIKHNSTYLSAYAHNDKIFIKEGQIVTRGQKIAAMGRTDTDTIKLHFEVRRLGKPIDPSKFIDFGKL